MTNANGNPSFLVIITISMLVAVIKTEHNTMYKPNPTLAKELPTTKNSLKLMI